MQPRPIEQWIEIFATNCSAEAAIANRILGDLVGYRSTSTHRDHDVAELANAIQAYARMIQKAGVTV